jgi:anti-anti-sigma factor
MEPLLNPAVDLVVELSTGTKCPVMEPCKVTTLDAPHDPTMIVVNLPEQVVASETRILVRDLRDQLTADSPCVLLDMSDVKEMDQTGFDLLLECLAETVRRDGTVRVRGISPEAATMLELTGMDELLNFDPDAATYGDELAPAIEYPEVARTGSQVALSA